MLPVWRKDWENSTLALYKMTEKRIPRRPHVFGGFSRSIVAVLHNDSPDQVRSLKREQNGLHHPIHSSHQFPFLALVMDHQSKPVAPTPDILLEEVPPLYGGRRAALSLNIVVVGAGIGGLAAAHTLAQARHRVTLLESARVLGDVGAGIQVSPNATRLLLRWGLGPALRAYGVEPTAISIRRYDTGERVGYHSCIPYMVRDHGAPNYQVHRADYHAMLHRLACTAPGVRICLGSAVKDVQPDPAVVGGPSVTLASGEVLYADLVVGADGLKSTLQKIVTSLDDMPEPTGDAAYRAVISTDLMLEDPELRPFVERPEATVWMAPYRHLVGYCIVSMTARAFFFFRNVRSESVWNLF